MKWLNIAIGIGALVSASASAAMYTWVDENGVKHFSDVPKSANAQKADPGELQTVESGGDALALARQLDAKKKSAQERNTASRDEATAEGQNVESNAENKDIRAKLESALSQ